MWLVALVRPVASRSGWFVLPRFVPLPGPVGVNPEPVLVVAPNRLVPAEVEVDPDPATVVSERVSVEELPTSVLVSVVTRS